MNEQEGFNNTNFNELNNKKFLMFVFFSVREAMFAFTFGVISSSVSCGARKLMWRPPADLVFVAFGGK